MRVEPYAVGSFVHIVKRGARGMPITGDDFDRTRFLQLLYYMNEEYFDESWEEDVRNKSPGYRPEHWPARVSLVSILAYTLMPNHFHLLVQENNEGGMSTFMQKIGQSMTNHFNLKYDSSGSIFQGSYRSRTIDSDTYLQYVAAYIMVKNVFELFPHGGIMSGVRDFKTVWMWALAYPFSNLGSYALGHENNIIDGNAARDILHSRENFKRFAKEVIEGGKWAEVEFE